MSRQCEFKISEAKTYSNLEDIIKLNIKLNNSIYTENKPKVYKCDIDSDKHISILSIKEWRQALKDFEEKYPNEVAKYKLLK